MKDFERTNFSMMLMTRDAKDLKEMAKLIKVERLYRYLKKSQERKHINLSRKFRLMGVYGDLSGMA